MSLSYKKQSRDLQTGFYIGGTLVVKGLSYYFKLGMTEAHLKPDQTSKMELSVKDWTVESC